MSGIRLVARLLEAARCPEGPCTVCPLLDWLNYKQDHTKERNRKVYAKEEQIERNRIAGIYMRNSALRNINLGTVNRYVTDAGDCARASASAVDQHECR